MASTNGRVAVASSVNGESRHLYAPRCIHPQGGQHRRQRIPRLFDRDVGIGIAIAATVDSSHVVHWVLCSATRRLTCVERPLPDGSECAVLYEGLPVATHVARSGQDLAAWTEQVRREWESVGWLSASGVEGQPG